jgi:hypothetical protein
VHIVDDDNDINNFIESTRQIKPKLLNLYNSSSRFNNNNTSLGFFNDASSSSRFNNSSSPSIPKFDV